jgi:hypothetical protein
MAVSVDGKPRQRMTGAAIVALAKPPRRIALHAPRWKIHTHEKWRASILSFYIIVCCSVYGAGVEGVADMQAGWCRFACCGFLK